MRTVAVLAALVPVWVADPCSIPKTLMTLRCGHVIIVENKTSICPYDPASCSVFVPGDCFDSSGAKQLSGYTLKCSYDKTKCSSATESTFNNVFNKVDSENPNPFDAVKNGKSLNEVGELCFDSKGKNTGSVVVSRQDRYCIIDTNCQAQLFTNESKLKAQVLLDLKRSGENSANPVININLQELGPDLSVDAFNQTTDNVNTLDLRYNQLTSISDTKFPSRMSFLDVSFNRLKSIGNLTHNAPNIQTLLAANNSMTTLDDIVFPATMTSLSFRNNQLKGTVNAEALPSSLRTLFLSQNQIELFSESFPPNLTVIDVGYNKIGVFDIAKVSPKIESLLLHSNELRVVKGVLPARINTLDLAANRLAEIPTFATPSNISILNLSYNAFPWTAASVFPTSIGVLNISGTPIQNGVLNASQLPSSLVGLDLSNCNINRIIGEFPSTLQTLRLDRNDLETWNMSNSMYRSLNGIPDLVLPSTSSTFNCPEVAKRVLSNRNYPVCILDLLPQNTGSTAVTSKDSTNYAVYAIVAGGLIIVLLIGGYIFYQRRYRDDSFSDDLSDVEVVQEFQKLGTSKRQDLTNEFNQYRIPMREIEILKPLLRTETQNDEVTAARTMLYKARFNERIVVLKTLTTEGTVPSSVAEDFVENIRLRSTLDHPNVVGFLGVVWSENAKIGVAGYGLILEYMAHGDLSRVLAFDSTKEPTQRLLQWTPHLPTLHPKTALLLNIASAIVYLHSFSPPVMHQNIQAKSILLGENWEAKLNGFKTSQTWEAPDLIAPPEVLRGEAWTEMADIYSFGILICELDLGHHPYLNEKNPENNKQIATLVKADLLQPTFSVECPVEIQDIAKKCLSFDKQSRPAAVEMEFWIRKLLRGQRNMAD